VLSPHEFATLMLIGETRELDWADLNADSLTALVERQLVRLEQRASGHDRLDLAHDGQALLQRIRGLRRDAG
jgi:hypothetical protein